MFTLHVTGLVVCAFTPTRLELLMLDASGSDEFAIPHHLPSLVARRSSVRSYSLSRLASLQGRFAGKFSNTDHVGWPLESVTGAGGQGGTPVKQIDGVTADHPDSNTPDWSSLHWVLDLNRMMPTGRLRDEYRRLGRYTNAILTLRGGRARGGDPFTSMGNHIWRVTDGYEQALTDTLDLQFDEPPSLEFRNADNALVGDIQWESSGEAWLINEAPERIRGNADLPAPSLDVNPDVSCEDARLYAEAMGQPAFPAISSVRTYGGGASTGAYCEVGRVDVSD